MCTSLPVDILAHLAALGTALVDAAQQQQQRDATLTELEAGVRAAVQAALPGLLTAVVHLATRDLDPGIATVRRRCPRCAHTVRRHRARPRTVATTCGPLTLRRPW